MVHQTAGDRCIHPDRALQLTSYYLTLVNEAVIDAGIAWVENDGDYYEGYMPKLGCSTCNQETLEYVDESQPEGR